MNQSQSDPEKKPFSQAISVGQLPTLLTGLEQRKMTGILHLFLHKDPKTSYQRVVIFNEGKIAYAGTEVPSLSDIANVVKGHLSGNWTELILKSHQSSPQALLEQFVFLNLCTWDQIQKLFLQTIVAALEPIMAYGGRFELDLKPHPPIFSGLPATHVVIQQIILRQAQWKEQAPSITDWDVRPLLTPSALDVLLDQQRLATHPDQRILKGLQHWLKQGGSLLEISERYHLDSLQLARVLQQGVNRNWIQFGSSERPTLLTVDDSDLMRQLISRILGKDYHVLVASNAMTALAILGQEPVQILLLDVSMPGVDGLELCRSIRSIKQFYSLPIIMVTGRDGLFDRVKGRMAGATDYLTKPFDDNQLKTLVARYISRPKTGE